MTGSRRARAAQSAEPRAQVRDERPAGGVGRNGSNHVVGGQPRRRNLFVGASDLDVRLTAAWRSAKALERLEFRRSRRTTEQSGRAREQQCAVGIDVGTPDGPLGHAASRAVLLPALAAQEEETRVGARPQRAFMIFEDGVDRGTRQSIGWRKGTNLDAANETDATAAAESHPQAAIARRVECLNQFARDGVGTDLAPRPEPRSIESMQARVGSEPQVSVTILRQRIHGSLRRAVADLPARDGVPGEDAAKIDAVQGRRRDPCERRCNRSQQRQGGWPAGHGRDYKRMQIVFPLTGDVATLNPNAALRVRTARVPAGSGNITPQPPTSKSLDGLGVGDGASH